MALPGGQPRTDFLAQGVAEASVRNVHDAFRSRTPVADGAVAPDAECAETGCAPIDPDHRVVLPSLSCPASSLPGLIIIAGPCLCRALSLPRLSHAIG